MNNGGIPQEVRNTGIAQVSCCVSVRFNSSLPQFQLPKQVPQILPWASRPLAHPHSFLNTIRRSPLFYTHSSNSKHLLKTLSIPETSSDDIKDKPGYGSDGSMGHAVNLPAECEQNQGSPRIVGSLDLGLTDCLRQRCWIPLQWMR